jgi:dTDP-4-amino-4,6-dideoxygalactose transaminase
MRVPFFDLTKQYALIRPEVDLALRQVFDNGRFVGGAPVATFEAHLGQALGGPHVLGVGNGTDALLIALKAFDLQPADEVITPAWSWISSAETITHAGGTPVFADVDDYFTLAADSVASKITNRTRGVVVVHLYGQAADLGRISALCQQHKLFLIEDCAQAHLTSYQNKCVGTFGDFGAFSFYPTKNLGAYGDAGALVTNHGHLAEQARRLANHGGLTKNEHLLEGLNSRLDTLQAALLGAKLPHLKKWNQQRLRHAEHYMQLLTGVGDLVLPKQRPDTQHTFHLFVIRTRQREGLRQFLAEHEIETMIHYPQALPFVPAYAGRKHSAADFPVATLLPDEVLSLPVYPELTNEQVDWVCEHVKKFFRQ